MPFKFFRNASVRRRNLRFRHLSFERLEDRRVLSATKADIVLLYDESGSGDDLNI